MSRSPEDEAHFAETVERLHLLASVMPLSADLKFVCAEMERADAFGCFVDPTAWMKSSDDRAVLAPYARAAYTFALAAEEFMDAAGALIAKRAAKS